MALVWVWLLAGAGSQLVTAGTARAAGLPATFTVQAPEARAVISTDPFRLRFQQAHGEAALSEVAAGSAAPVIVPPTDDPVAPGYDNASTTTLYDPLTFMVGSESISQYNGAIWGGDLMSGTRTGIIYSARRVISERQIGTGVRLTVSTNDPSGRTLAVTLSPDGQGAIRVSVAADPTTGVVEVGDSFASTPDEAFFGFGGRHDAVNQRGQTFSSFVEEENLDGFGLQNPSAPPSVNLFPNGPDAAYYPQAEFFSSRPYGFLLDQPQLAWFKLDAGGREAWNVTASAASLDYVVAPGAAPTAVRSLTALTGRQPVPPSWALGPMLDRLVKNFGESESDYESNVTADLANISRYHLPLTAYRLEGWGLPGAGNDGLSLHSWVTQPFQSHVFAELHARHIHPLVYLRSWITPGSAPSQEGLVVKKAGGQPYETTNDTGTSSIELLDFTNPAAVAFWRQEVDKALNLGADGFMQDYGEEILYDMHFADGETGVTMHNRYPILYARATREAITAYEKAHPGRHIFFFTRSGYSGLPGSTAYEGGNFPGDETTDWSHASGLASLTSDMLGRAVDGAFGYGTDIGGYFDYTSPPTTKELFLRWAEWAALSPIFRLHGSGRSGTHTPWSYDSQTVQIYDSLSRLHLAAVPLILKLWREGEKSGIPPTRPLWLQYPSERATYEQDQEWLLGPNVLVAPVVTNGATSRGVYFPRGCWQSTVTGLRYQGPESRNVSAPLSALPYFFTCGTHPFAVPAPAAKRCPAATGRLGAHGLGPVRLGEERRQIRRRFRRVSGRRLRNMDFLCLRQRGIRVAYPSAALLSHLRRAQAGQLRNRVILALSADRRYSLRGIRPGDRSAGLRRLRAVRHYIVGRNTWYVLARRSSTGVFKVQRGRVREVGIANRRLTRGRRATRRLLKSF
jgi:alpha-glucosidase (family GH31 glycosyl hydrolase)